MGKPIEVASGTEGSAGSGEEDGARSFFSFERGKEAREFAVELIVDGVEFALGMIDCDSENVVDVFDAKRFKIFGVN